MEDSRYANAYTEVLEVLGNLRREDYEKIPQKYIRFLEANCNSSYEFHYDKTKRFEDQVLLDDTRYILFGIFKKYGSTDEQKQEIEEHEKSYYVEIENRKREQYNSNNMFKKSSKDAIESSQVYQNENSITTTEQKTFFDKLVAKIKEFFCFE